MIYPIVEYAHKIGKNTAEFTTMDMVRFQEWWVKYPKKEVVTAAIKKQLKRVVAIHQQSERIKQEERMGKTIKSVKLQAAMNSRLSSDQVEDIEQVEEDYEVVEIGEGEIAEEEVSETLPEEESVADMGLTKTDVAALLWCVTTMMTDYDMTDHKYEASLVSLKEGLEGV